MEQNYNNYNGYNGYNYNAYGNQENQNGNREKKPSFGVTLMKTVAIALVFGLVSGVAASTVLYFTGIPLVNFSEIEEREQEENS